MAEVRGSGGGGDVRHVRNASLLRGMIKDADSSVRHRDVKRWTIGQLQDRAAAFVKEGRITAETVAANVRLQQEADARARHNRRRQRNRGVDVQVHLDWAMEVDTILQVRLFSNGHPP